VSTNSAAFSKSTAGPVREHGSPWASRRHHQAPRRRARASRPARVTALPRITGSAIRELSAPSMA